MLSKIKKLHTYISKHLLLDKNKRKRLELGIISGVFFLAGTVFTIINFITKEYTLGYVTLAFGVVSLITLIVTVIKSKLMHVAQILFVFSALIMFVYFMIAGGAGDSGFSTYWIIVLPFVSMMVLGLYKGTIVTALMFICICLFLWVPGIRDNLLQWTPDRTFIVRFPLVYLAAFAASALFEYSRFLTDKANVALNNQLENAASHDALTGLTNRYGLNEIVKNFTYKTETGEDVTVGNSILIDVDNFKSANDLYGHMFGDKVLVEIANVLRKHAGEWAIRFGGDEFVLLYVNKSIDEMLEIGESIRKEVEEIVYEDHPEVKFTVSVGVASHEVDMSYQIDKVIELADIQSTRAKKSGKNRVYVLDYSKSTHPLS